MYAGLENVLRDALRQASQGKGHDRHANGKTFEEQPMMTISGLLGTNAGCLYQAMKKIQESTRMDQDAAVRELLGAINYIGGAVLLLQQEPKQNLPREAG